MIAVLLGPGPLIALPQSNAPAAGPRTRELSADAVADAGHSAAGEKLAIRYRESGIRAASGMRPDSLPSPDT